LLDTSQDKLKNIVSTFILKPIDYSYTTKESVVIYANVKNMVMSCALQLLKSLNYTDITTIWFISPGSIHFDENLGMEIASGKNIVVACKDMYVDSNVKINVSGRDGAPLSNTAASGTCGNNGANAGNICIYVSNQIYNYPLTLVANGGNGSRSADGTRGAKGSSGKNGDDGSYTTYFGGEINATKYSAGGTGKVGDPGGDGTNAGEGGKGGLAGSVLILPENNQDTLKRDLSITTKAGTAGTPGSGGEGGDGGYHGYSTISFSKSGVDKTFLFRGYFNESDFKRQDKTFSYRVWIEGKPYVYSEFSDGGKYPPEGPPREYASKGLDGNCGGITKNTLSADPAIPQVGKDAVISQYKSYYPDPKEKKDAD
jgi:hypothetical protein